MANFIRILYIGNYLTTRLAFLLHSRNLTPNEKEKELDSGAGSFYHIRSRHENGCCTYFCCFNIRLSYYFYQSCLALFSAKQQLAIAESCSRYIDNC